MSNLRDIKRRIKSVRNTSQITKAMQMVASAKMRRAQELALRGRVYVSAIASVFRHLKESLNDVNVELMKTNPHGKTLCIVISTDRGLCGALNSNLLKELLICYLEELKDARASGEDSFVYGEQTAYTECLEWIALWEGAAEHGLDFTVEERYPL